MSVEADVKHTVKYTAHIQPLTSCLNNSISLYLTRLSRVKRKMLNWRLHFCKVALVWSKRMRTHTHRLQSARLCWAEKKYNRSKCIKNVIFKKKKTKKQPFIFHVFLCFSSNVTLQCSFIFFFFFNLVIFKRWRIWRLLVKKVQFELLSFYFFKYVNVKLSMSDIYSLSKESTGVCVSLCFRSSSRKCKKANLKFALQANINISLILNSFSFFFFHSLSVVRHT